MPYKRVVSQVWFLFSTIVAVAATTAMLACSYHFDPQTDQPEFHFDTARSTVKHDNETVYNDSTVIRWSSVDEFVLFQYRFDDEASWTGKAKDNKTFAARLDDGPHRIIVHAYDPVNTTGTVKTLHFTVRTLHGPCMYLYPRQQYFSNDSAVLWIRTKNVTFDHLTLAIHGCTLVNTVKADPGMNAAVIFSKKNDILFMKLDAAPVGGDAAVMKLFVRRAQPPADTVKVELRDLKLFHNDTARAVQVRGAFVLK